ncbi:aminoglycoside phosphotransferase family protein [Microbacterium deminutum]|uniref:Aminoglycoside phosphotransferase family protein n=2 Tax=Microbacterium deminutum TaxID=344164 RepID=A0ABN2R482_9MICO
MHDDQLEIDDDAVRRLIADQFPQWGRERVERLHGSGTVNAIFRIGPGLTARFPLNEREPAAAENWLRQEASAFDELADCIPFAAPRHAAFGRAGEGYPLPWAVQTWVEGEIATPDGMADSAAFANDLVELIRAMRSADRRGRTFGGAGRGGDLRAHDEWVATCVRESAADFDAERLAALWDGFRALPRTGEDVMVHGDLIPANLLVHEGRLAGVLDGGGFGPADPALELVCAWHLLDPGARAVLRTGLDVDDVQWVRGAAWAFVQAMGLGWYYRDSDPVMSALGLSTVGRIVTDAEIADRARAAGRTAGRS